MANQGRPTLAAEFDNLMRRYKVLSEDDEQSKFQF